MRKHSIVGFVVILLLLTACGKESLSETNVVVEMPEISAEQTFAKTQDDLAYVPNQVLVSAHLDVDKSVIEGLAEELDAEIVEYIALTNDYQFVFHEQKTTEELEAIIDYLCGLPHISNASLNYVMEYVTETEVSTEAPDEAEQEEGIVYTEEDIFLTSFDCGCIMEYDLIQDEIVVIETEEQLVFAEESYGWIVNPTEEKEPGYFESPIADVFQSMKAEYPICDYTYVVMYQETTSGVYYYHADRLRVTEDHVGFLMDEESTKPDAWFERVTEDMGGFCHMAAVPKEYLAGYEFPYVFYPDPNDMYQDRYYWAEVDSGLADETLYEVYGDSRYIIRDEEEYARFLEKSEGVHLLWNRKSIKLPFVDFEKGALLVYFITEEETDIAYEVAPVEITDTSILLQYEGRSRSWSEPCSTQTCMVYACIPHKYLTQESYEGWITP